MTNHYFVIAFYMNIFYVMYKENKFKEFIYCFLLAIIPLNKAKPPHRTAQTQPQIETIMYSLCIIREIIIPAIPNIKVNAPMMIVIKSRCFIVSFSL